MGSTTLQRTSADEFDEFDDLPLATSHGQAVNRYAHMTLDERIQTARELVDKPEGVIFALRNLGLADELTRELFISDIAKSPLYALEHVQRLGLAEPEILIKILTSIPPEYLDMFYDDFVSCASPVDMSSLTAAHREEIAASYIERAEVPLLRTVHGIGFNLGSIPEGKTGLFADCIEKNPSQIQEIIQVRFDSKKDLESLVDSVLERSPDHIAVLCDENVHFAIETDGIWMRSARRWPIETAHVFAKTPPNIETKPLEIAAIAVASWIENNLRAGRDDVHEFYVSIARLNGPIDRLVDADKPTYEEVSKFVSEYLRYVQKEGEVSFDFDVLPLTSKERVVLLETLADKYTKLPYHWATSDEVRLRVCEKALSAFSPEEAMHDIRFDDYEIYKTLIKNYPQHAGSFIKHLERLKKDESVTPEQLVELCEACIEIYDDVEGALVAGGKLRMSPSFSKEIRPIYKLLVETPEARNSTIAKLVSKEPSTLSTLLSDGHSISARDIEEIVLAACPTTDPGRIFGTLLQVPTATKHQGRKLEFTRLEEIYRAYAEHDESVLGNFSPRLTPPSILMRVADVAPIQAALVAQQWQVSSTEGRALATSAVVATYPVVRGRADTDLDTEELCDLLDAASKKLPYQKIQRKKVINPDAVTEFVNDWNPDIACRHGALYVLLCILGQKDGLFADADPKTMKEYGESGVLHSYARYDPEEVARNFSSEFIADEKSRASLAELLLEDEVATTIMLQRFEHFELSDTALVKELLTAAAQKQTYAVLEVFFEHSPAISLPSDALQKAVAVAAEIGELGPWLNTDKQRKAVVLAGWSDAQEFRDGVFRKLYFSEPATAMNCVAFLSPSPEVAGEKFMDWGRRNKYQVSLLKAYEIDDANREAYLLAAFKLRPLKTVQDVSGSPVLALSMRKVLSDDALLGTVIADRLLDREEVRPLLEQIIAIDGKEPTIEETILAWKRYWPHAREALVNANVSKPLVDFVEYLAVRGNIPSNESLDFLDRFGDGNAKFARAVVLQCGDTYATEVFNTLNQVLRPSDLHSCKPIIQRFLKSGYRGFTPSVFREYRTAYESSPLKADKLIEELKVMSAALLTGQEAPDEIRGHRLYPETVFDAYKPVNITINDVKRLVYSDLDRQEHLEGYQVRSGGYSIEPNAKGVLSVQVASLIAFDKLEGVASLFKPRKVSEETPEDEAIIKEFKQDLSAIILAGAPKDKARFLWALAYLSKDERFGPLVEELKTLSISSGGLQTVAIVVPRLQEGLNVIFKDMATEALKEHALALFNEKVEGSYSQQAQISQEKRLTKIRQLARVKEDTPMSDEEILETVHARVVDAFREERQILNREARKLQSSGDGPPRKFVGYISKVDHAYFGRAGAGLCTATENWSWNNPEFTQMIIADPESTRIVGNIQLHLFTGPDGKPSVLARLNPTSKILETVDEKSMAIEMIGAVREFAKDNELTIYLPEQTGWHELSNRDGFALRLMKFYGEEFEFPVQITQSYICERIYKLKGQD